MATNRDSKQKRARQNRAQREAREARTKAAAVPADERKAKYASSAPTSEAPSKTKGARGEPRPRPERRLRPGDTPVDLDTLEGSWYRKRISVPGGRQVLTGMVLTVLITVMTLVYKYPDPDLKGGVKAPKGSSDVVTSGFAALSSFQKAPTESFTATYGAIGIPLLLMPLLAMAIATYFILSPQRRRIWTICAFVASLGAVVFGLPYFFPVGFLVYAIMRANKIEGPVPGSRAARALEAREAAARGEEPVDPDA